MKIQQHQQYRKARPTLLVHNHNHNKYRNHSKNTNGITTSSFTDGAVEDGSPGDRGRRHHDPKLPPSDPPASTENQPLSDFRITVCGGEERTGEAAV